MSRRHLWISAVIIAAVILIAFAFSAPHTRDVGTRPAPPAAKSVPVVTVHDSFAKGVHTITGSLEAPDACTPVSAQAALSGTASTTESVLVALSLTEDEGVCLQVPTRVNFKTTVSAPASVPIVVTVNGAVASTTPS